MLKVLLVSLVDLGWGRGGLLGGGSSVVALGGDLVPQGSPKDLDIFWKRLLFFSFFLFPPGSFSGFFSRGSSSWSRGCKGVVAASHYWFFTRVAFIFTIL